MLAAVRAVAATAPSLGTLQEVDKAHGRLEVRHATFFSLAALPLAPRWQHSGLCQVVRVERTTEQLKTAKRSQAVAYYVTNQEATTPPAHDDLFAAIRGHWGCEADHWIRDVTLHEDQILVKQSTQAHVLGSLRTLVIGLFRRAGVSNMRAMLTAWLILLPCSLSCCVKWGFYEKAVRFGVAVKGQEGCHRAPRLGRFGQPEGGHIVGARWHDNQWLGLLETNRIVRSPWITTPFET